jgi:hypothetical protein
MLILVKKIHATTLLQKTEPKGCHGFSSSSLFISFLVRRLIGFLAWFWRDILVMRIEIGRSIGAATSPIFLDKYIVSCFALMHTHTKKT